MEMVSISRQIKRIDFGNTSANIIGGSIITIIGLVTFNQSRYSYYLIFGGLVIVIRPLITKLEGNNYYKLLDIEMLSEDEFAWYSKGFNSKLSRDYHMIHFDIIKIIEKLEFIEFNRLDHGIIWEILKVWAEFEISIYDFVENLDLLNMTHDQFITLLLKPSNRGSIS